MLPLWDTLATRRAPVLTALLVVSCLAVFGYEVVLLTSGPSLLESWLTAHAVVPARFCANWTESSQWLTVATSMFLHGGVAHVLGNCWFLWVFGNNVEDRLGFLGFGLFYLFTGAVAALLQVVVHPGSQVPVLGASGAISGVLGAYLILFPRAWIVSIVPWIVPVLPVPAVIFLPLWFWMQVCAGWGAFLSGPSDGGGVAWFAHIGGFLAGVGVALMLPGRGRR